MGKGERTSRTGARNLGSREEGDAKMFRFCRHSELEDGREGWDGSCLSASAVLRKFGSRLPRREVPPSLTLTPTPSITRTGGCLRCGKSSVSWAKLQR